MFSEEQAEATWQALERYKDGELSEYKLSVLVTQFDGLMLDGDVRAAALLYLTLFAYSREKPRTFVDMVSQFDIIGRYLFTDATRRYEVVLVRVVRGMHHDDVLDVVLREVENVVSLSPTMRNVRALQRLCVKLRVASDDSNVRWVCKRVCKPGLTSVTRAAVVEHALTDVPVLVRAHVPAAVEKVLHEYAAELSRDV